MIGFDWWLYRARRGDQFATGLMWSCLRNAVKQRSMTDEEWTVLTMALDAIAADTTPNKAQNAVNHALSFGRRAGRWAAFQVEERSLAMATEVFDLIGGARGAKLDKACETVLMRQGIGVVSDTQHDLRGLRKAYRDHLPFLLELQQLSREADLAREADLPPECNGSGGGDDPP